MRGNKQENIFYVLLCCLLIILLNSSAYAEGFSTYLSINSFSHSEPTALKSIIDDWDEKIYPGDLAFSVSRAEIGVEWKKWQLGYIYRYDYYFEFNADTALLKHHVENKIEFTPGKQMDIYLSANTLIADGLSLRHQENLGNVTISVTASYLRGKRFMSGKLAGEAELLTDKDYDMSFDVDYYYSKDKLFGRKVESPDGRGYAIDFNMDWKFDDKWNFNINITDLIARMYWYNAPRTIATANTDTKEYDEDGYVVFRPVASGLETNNDFVQTIPSKLFFSTKYMLEKNSIVFEYHDYELKKFYSVGASHNISTNKELKILYNLTAEAIKLSYHTKIFRIMLTTDDIELNRARTFGLQFYINYPF